MSNRRESIISLVESYTHQHILDGSLDFGNCNAHIIAVDLKIDRTNVSRILNELYKEGEFIKISGRPTLYASVRAIVNHFPYISIPRLITGQDDIHKYFPSTSADISKSASARFDMVGSSITGSIYKSISQILPVLYYPSEELKIIIIRGERGVGKKHFLRQFLQRGQEMGTIRKDQQIFYTDAEIINMDPLYELSKLEKNNYGIVSIEVTKDAHAECLSSFINRIYYCYHNKSQKQPYVAFLIDSSVKDYFRLHRLTPYHAYFPPLSKRPIHELVELIFSIIQLESNRLGQEVYISKDILIALSLGNYSENILQLRNEVIYALSSSFFLHTVKADTPIKLDISCLSDDFIQNLSTPSNTQNSMLSQLPETIVIKPNATIDLTSLMKQKGIRKANPANMKQNSKAYSIRTLILNLPTDLYYYSFPFQNITLKDNLSSLLEATLLSKDPILSDFTLSMIDQLICGKIDINDYSFETLKEASTLTSSVHSKLIRTLRNATGAIDSDLDVFLKQLIIEVFDIANHIQIPILFINHGFQLSDDYALVYNHSYGKRIFHSLNYSPDDQKTNFSLFTKKVCKYVQKINRGKGVLLFADHDPLTKLDSSIFIETQLLTFTISPVSILNINNVITLINNTNTGIVSLSSSIIRLKNESRSYLADYTLNDKMSRNDGSILEYMTTIFQDLDLSRTNKSLYRLLKKICSATSITPDNELIIDFLFHGNCILNRIFREDTPYCNTSPINIPHINLVDTIREMIAKNNELCSINFAPTDYLIFHDCINCFLARKQILL